MNKRIEKRHKRQVSRAKQRVRLSEPDVRTPEQMKADREASRPDGARGYGPSSAPSFRARPAPATGRAAKSDFRVNESS
jgi:hypothetical protein